MEDLGYWVIGITVACYVVFAAFGIIGRKYSKTVKGYAITERGFPAIILGFSSFATWMSASSWMGVPAMAFAFGWPFWWQAVAVAIMPTIGTLLVALRLKMDADRYGAVSLVDYYGHRFNSGLLRIVLTIFVLVWALSLTISQFKATGTVFAYSVGIDYAIGVLIGALIVCIYVPMGGFMATTATDVIQGIIMIVSTILLAPLVFSVAGGLPEISVKMAAIDPKYNQVFYGTWTPVAAFCVALYWLMWYVAAPYLGRLYISLKKPDWREVVKFGVFFQLGQTFGMLLWYTGFAALALGIKPKPPFGYDLAIVEFGIRYTPPILTPLLGLAFVGILAAVLSSVEDFIHNASVELGHTVIGEFIPSLRRKEVASLWICRIIVWGIVVVAIVYAIISPPPLLSIFMYYVAGPLLAASFISLMIGLYHRNAVKIAVEIAAIASIAGTLASYFILPPVYTGHFSVPPSFGLMIGLIVYGIMHLYLRAKKPSK